MDVSCVDIACRIRGELHTPRVRTPAPGTRFRRSSLVAQNLLRLCQGFVTRHREVTDRVSLDVDGVGGAVSGDVNDYGIRLGLRKMRNATRFGVETSGRQSLLGRRARDWTVTEVPNAGDNNGSAIVAVRMCLDLGVCRNAQ